MHGARIAVSSVATVLARPLFVLVVAVFSASLFIAGLASCDLGIDVDALSAGCDGACDGAEASTEGGRDAGDAPDAGASDAPDRGGRDAAMACPDAAGGAMARVSLGDASVCVDRVEVTNRAYAAFLDAAAPGAAPAGCDPGASHAPASWPPPAGRDALPVASVTWCDAHAFCAWAGKRLCGAIGGGPLDPSLLGRASFDEWFAVCSNDGKATYPYGDAYAPVACNGNDYGTGGPVPVGSLGTCASRAGGPLDLSGNVWEWIDACDPQGRCYARGGAYNSPPSELACAGSIASLRTVGAVTIGFRCCSP
jgi:sulfatase modifying factor 1